MRAVVVVGAGLAGCEAALQCARHGVPVRLFEMRPAGMTEAHQTGDVAELVCSNSLKSEETDNAHGLLKAELRILGSVLLQCADRARVPGGKALVVDRRRFSAEVQAELDKAGIEIVREEVTRILGGATAVIATGPLTSPAMADELGSALGANRLFFYDAIAPIVAADSIDRTRVFEGSRYGAGSDYLNCPLNPHEYDRLVDELLESELHPLHEFEPRFFEGCLPVEELARRGRMVLAFGPMKPVGLHFPENIERPLAVVQLRRENAAGTMYNIVGFQTRLKRPEQERVFRLIPGLERAEFLRFGSMHRNTYLQSPRLLRPTLQVRRRPEILIAGQLAGVEGYVESIGAGLVAGLNAARLNRREEPFVIPPQTMLGGLLAYLAGPNDDFQPMNANFGLLPPMPRQRGPDRHRAMTEQALAAVGVLAASVAGRRR